MRAILHHRGSVWPKQGEQGREKREMRRAGVGAGPFRCVDFLLWALFLGRSVRLPWERA